MHADVLAAYAPRPVEPAACAARGHEDPVTRRASWSYGLAERTCRRCGAREDDRPLTPEEALLVRRALGRFAS